MAVELVDQTLTIESFKQYNQWVCASNPDKAPINPRTGGNAMPNNSSTWTSFERAYKRWQSEPERLLGIGFVLTKKQGVTCIDLDDCIDEDGKLKSWARAIVERLNSYTEYSPSGQGLHIWVKGQIPKNIPADLTGITKVEMYDHEHYMTITGNLLEGTPKTIEPRNSEVRLLYTDICEAREQAATVAREEKRKAKTQSNADDGQKPTIKGTEKDTRYGLKALQEECADLASTQEGGRWKHLQVSAFRMGQLVGGNELTYETAKDALEDAAYQCGLTDKDITKTLEPCLDAGMDEPRSAPPRQEIDLCSFDADDSGNGDAMYALFGKQFLWCGARGWFYYTGTHWKLDSEGAQVKQKAVDALRQRRHAAVERGVEDIIKATRADDRRVNGCVNRFKSLVDVDIDEFDNNPDMLNCKNGAVDLRSGVIEPHCYTQRFTYCLEVEYDPDVPILPEWEEYLHNVVGGGQEVIDYLQMALGYSLTGRTNEECLFYIYGPTRSGKGTLEGVYKKLLPSPLYAGVDFNTFTAKREGDTSNFDLAPLKPSRMIFASESNEYQSLNPAKIKSLTGGDDVWCCFKHKSHFSYKPQYKVWMLSNQPVNGNPDDGALWTRVKVIEFPNSYAGKEDKSKKARLESPEAQQSILTWTVQGAIKWYQLGARGLIAPPQVVNATNNHRASMDFVQQWLDECCELSNDDRVTSNEQVYASYTGWCESNGVSKKGNKGLTQSLKAKGYQAGVNGKGVVKGKPNQPIRGVRGLKIKDIDTSTLWQEIDQKVTVTDGYTSSEVSTFKENTLGETQNQVYPSVTVTDEKVFSNLRDFPTSNTNLKRVLEEVSTILERKQRERLTILWCDEHKVFGNQMIKPTIYADRVLACLESGKKQQVEGAVTAIKRTLYGKNEEE